jgi:hypothetical protein
VRGSAQDADPARAVLDHRKHEHADPDRVTVSRKSQASNASACERRKSAHVLEARSGAGSIPASLRISHTVEAATFTPSTSSSPCSRRYPQLGCVRDLFDELRLSRDRQLADPLEKGEWR